MPRDRLARWQYRERGADSGAPYGDRVRDDLVARVEKVFERDGALARTLAGFEPRPAQREMAIIVASTMSEDGVALVEAGTGTGKTLAYLVPAILSGKRVLVSTGTKNLQEQIVEKDLPVLTQGPRPAVHRDGDEGAQQLPLPASLPGDEKRRPAAAAAAWRLRTARL